MIVLSLLKLLEGAGFGAIGQDLHAEKLGLDKKGIYVVSLGGSHEKGKRDVFNFELYIKGTDDLETAKISDKLWQFFRDGQFCHLEAYKKGFKSYDNVSITPLNPPINLGLNINGQLIYSFNIKITL